MPVQIEKTAREEIIAATIQSFVELVLTEKFADMPGWMEADLTVSQVRAIYLLAFKGSLTVSSLAKSLNIGAPAASVLVQQLVQQSLIVRSEDDRDRRRMLVSLTEKGAELVNGRRDLREAKFRSRLAKMSDEEITGLLRGVQALAEIVRQEKAELESQPSPK